MKKLMSLLMILMLLMFTVVLTGCLETLGSHHVKGGGIGAIVGAVAGGLLDKKNPWRGGVIGGGLGLVLGGTLADISGKASKQAAETNRPVQYRTEDGRGQYRADPMGVNPQTKCRYVRERVWEDGKVVKDNVKEICKGEKEEGVYDLP